MDIASRVAKYEERGFTPERAQVNVLMEAAAFAIFRDFPEAFVLFGGASLVLFHESMRHSADLDLCQEEHRRHRARRSLLRWSASLCP